MQQPHKFLLAKVGVHAVPKAYRDTWKLYLEAKAIIEMFMAFMPFTESVLLLPGPVRRSAAVPLAQSLLCQKASQSGCQPVLLQIKSGIAGQ